MNNIKPTFSMTGYATAKQDFTSDRQDSECTSIANLQVDIRSVNSRFLDLHFRMPDEIRSIEPELRRLLAQKLRRGKVELRIAINSKTQLHSNFVSEQTLNDLQALCTQVRSVISDASPLSITDIIRMGQTPVELESIQEHLLNVTQQALKALLDARLQEGQRLSESILQRSAAIRSLAKEAAPLIPQIVEQQQQRFLERWEKALEQTQPLGTTISLESAQERALSEAAAYAIRIDVAEELTRIHSHLDEIERLLNKGGENGKRLDFLIQELHREANTLGSKSSDIQLTQISVEMKVLIEQMREQVQNIE